MRINSTSNNTFTSLAKPVLAETIIKGGQAVTIREAQTSKDLSKVAKAMTKAFRFRFRLANELGTKRENFEAREQFRLMSPTTMTKSFVDYLKDILSIEDKKTTVLMVEDKYDKDKVIGYAIMHTAGEENDTAIIDDASMEYEFREPFGLYLLHNITNSAKGLYDKILTRRFPIATACNPEYNDLGYRLVDEKKSDKLNFDYGDQPYEWLEKNLISFY